MAPERREVTYQRRASTDVQKAYRWYEEQRPGLGEDFLTGLKQAEDLAAALPLACPRVHRNTRRALLRRFPYGLYFRLGDNELIVVACYHASRDPEGWRRRG
ncbi:MAG: type II toxin-antitoxin system RelE/ParE family toxin [Acidobacteriota bacterium]